VPTDGELELSFYEKFLWGRGLEPYPVQEQAIAHIFAGRSLLVTVPTGTGKCPHPGRKCPECGR
jgi:Lhr-like helicase